MDRKICLDSDILIELLNKNEVVGKAIESLEADFYVTPISVFEVWYGRKEKENISGLLESLHVLIFDRESAFLAADILREHGVCVIRKGNDGRMEVEKVLRPEPDAIFESDPAKSGITEAKIIISSANGDNRNVLINSTGQISIGRGN